MTFQQFNLIQFYSFEIFETRAVKQAIFCRQGGVSPAPWASLNHGGTVGDERSHVVENRRRIFEAFGRPVESLFDVWQVHGTEVICADRPRPLDEPHQKADAILTDRPEVTLYMRFADCVPILLHDPVRKVTGLVHAGWQGTVKKILAVTIERMQEHYGSNPADILAGIGPSIGPDHYEIGGDVADLTRQAFGADAAGILLPRDGKLHLDLWTANSLVLQAAGVRHIQVAGICTACDVAHWYSHRAEKGKTGRFGALMALKA